MNAIEILGELLGHKGGQSGRGADVLKDIFGKRSSSSTQSPSPSKPPNEIHRQAQELEDLLNVANGSRSNRSNTSQSQRRQDTTVGQQRTARPNSEPIRDSDNERATVLIRAMVNASKADGRIDQNEQQKILSKLGSQSRENIDFLRRLFAESLDVQGFVKSVPLGMEQQVYTMSLIAIDLDEGSEANYLIQLADGLRIPIADREQIHKRLGAPSVY